MLLSDKDNHTTATLSLLIRKSRSATHKFEGPTPLIYKIVVDVVLERDRGEAAGGRVVFGLPPAEKSGKGKEREKNSLFIFL